MRGMVQFFFSFYPSRLRKLVRGIKELYLSVHYSSLISAYDIRVIIIISTARLILTAILESINIFVLSFIQIKYIINCQLFWQI